MPDLDYDLQTSNQLVNAYAWLRSDALRTLFRERARVPDGPALDRARSLLLSALNRKIGSVMTLSASVDSVAVAGLYVTPTALVLRGEARGRAAVDGVAGRVRAARHHRLARLLQRAGARLVLEPAVGKDARSCAH